MNVFYKHGATEIEKKQISLKPIKKDGLVLQIHHTTKIKSTDKRIRFLYSAFDISGLIVANADIDGNIFIVDFSTNKFWSLPKFHSCSVLAFSPLQPNHLIVGTNNGELYISDIHLGTSVGVLLGHNYPVKIISFADNQCLTASSTQAIIFNLNTLCKIHELKVESPASLKQIFFMPVTNHIIACFADDYIHVWKNKTFESFKKLLPTEWNKFSLKSIAITRNGTTMVLAGIAPKLIIFSLDSWTLTKILNLSEEITVKSVHFVSQSHDGGANKFLILLANNGIIHFLDMEQNLVIAKIHLESVISSFTSSVNGTHLACVLKSGEVNIYKLSHFIEPLTLNTSEQNGHVTNRKRTKLYLPPQKQLKEELNINKLQGILKEYGEYPESYRTLIWSKILVLPYNLKSFATIMNKGYNKYFNNIDQKYPLVNKSVLRNLKRLLSNLGNWCAIFCHIDFLPLFVFPFVKVFENEPIVCFEAVTTIILNWCQHWFEYIPCIPVNTLAMVENILAEHDAPLLGFLTSKGVTSLVYAWPMLQTAFSEILTIKEWCILWDHILSNEPSFMLMVPVAFNILCRSCLATLSAVECFESFYSRQNPIGIQKIISKSYYLLNKTSEQNHPRKYLKHFEKLPVGRYPIFDDYSKVLLKVDCRLMNEMKDTEMEINNVQTEIAKYKEIETAQQENLKIQEEETKRIQKLEDMYQEKLQQEKETVNRRKIKLSKLKTDLMEMQAESMEVSRRKMEEMNLNDKKRELDRLLKNIDYNELQCDLDIQRTEEDISKHYCELLKQKMILEDILQRRTGDDIILPEKYSKIAKQSEKIKQELEKIRKNVYFNRIKNTVSIPLGISIANEQTQNINMTFAKEMAAKKFQECQCSNNRQVIKMENDTKELEIEVQNLLDQFTNAKQKEANDMLGRLAESICDRKRSITENKKLMQGSNPTDSTTSSSGNCNCDTNYYCPYFQP